MNELTFVTGNQKKLAEAREILPDFTINNIRLDLPEIQSVRVVDVITAKLADAVKQVSNAKNIVCEDTGLFIAKWNNLPGALIKHHLEHLGTKKLCELTAGSDADAVTVVGYQYDATSAPQYFTGKVRGKISWLHPTSLTDTFGWDPIFIPKVDPENTFSFAEMSSEQKSAISMRAQAFRKLGDFLRKSRVDC